LRPRWGNERCPIPTRAKPADKHLAATVHCVDDEIIAPLGSKPFLTVDIACVTLWKIFAP